ncbi:nuclear receptor-interacting protein 1 [Pelobates fuscus]|uniref:nuclear receptor-interacting protein 1 n=1 Tax=Pelobates fuscus TaxID=191477 RepID=UPI002FE48F4B
MTHGEELSSEMQQDSIVLTYLEGLLMHQAAGGSGTAVDKHSVGHAKDDDNLKISGNVFSNSKNNAPVNSLGQGSGMLHLKKARLLQSSEDWNAAKRRRLSASVVGINGNNDALLAGMVENVPKGKQDSTLLASLLQSFSSRLQSVALSQQIKQSLKDQGFSISQEPVHEEKDSRCYGAASNHLKTLLNKSKVKDKIIDNNLTGLLKKSHQENYVKPTLSGQNGSKGTVEPISCAARLQAVANMVVKRSSPTASPKPSVACSQLALLLSSEAHLQQYSREHALKAQSASQLASERLAAMARLKESSESDLHRFQLSTNLPAKVSSPVRPMSNGIGNVGNVSPFPNQLGVPSSPLKTAGFKTHTERNHVKQSPNNSLLLHLLKSQNAPSVSTSHLHSDKYSFEESATPTTTDDFSDNNPSFTEDETSDDESTHSNCVPIDLSFKNRVDKPVALTPASIDNLTESLLHNWDPKVEGIDLGREKDTSMDTTLKPYQKVTLLQLLLGHKIDESQESIVDARGTAKAADLTKFNLQGHSHVSENTSIHKYPQVSSPLNTLPLHNAAKADSPVNLTHQPFPIKPNFTSYISNLQTERLVNPASKHLIELTRNKVFQPPVPVVSNNTQSNDSFSASKLLQNLAQCGMQTAAPEERLQKPLHSSNGTTVGLVERLDSPHDTKPSSSFEEVRTFNSPSTPVDSGFPSSEIENLLERRTVLQLLLGTTNKGKNEKVQKTVIKNECQQGHVEKIVSEQIVSFKIKTEPDDVSNAQHLRETGVPSPTWPSSLHKTARSSPEESKPQHLSPHDFNGSRNGLLSRLLQQNHDGYDTNDLDISRHEIKQTESKIPSVVPKKRKMHQNEPLESQVKLARIVSPDSSNRQFCSTKSFCTPFFLQEDMNGNKSEYEHRGTMGQSSYNESKNVSWSRENKGFNVLKQLLLSENCVRDLSQHRTHTSAEELMRPTRSNLAGNSDFLAPSLNVLMGKHSQTNSLDQITFPYPSSLNNSHHTPQETSGNNISMASSGPVNTSPVPNDKGPIKWVITGMEKNEFGKDYPRLTKTNPILYYMLQKGAHSAANQDLRDRNIWTESLLAKSNELTLKRESVNGGITSSSSIGLTKPSNHAANKSFHNSNGSKYGLFDMLAIKNEPE